MCFESHEKCGLDVVTIAGEKFCFLDHKKIGCANEQLID